MFEFTPSLIKMQSTIIPHISNFAFEQQFYHLQNQLKSQITVGKNPKKVQFSEDNSDILYS